MGTQRFLQNAGRPQSVTPRLNAARERRNGPIGVSAVASQRQANGSCRRATLDLLYPYLHRNRHDMTTGTASASHSVPNEYHADRTGL